MPCVRGDDDGLTGRSDIALERVCKAEDLLQHFSDPVSLGWAIARRAEVEHLAGRPLAAQRTLERAEAIAAAVHPSEDSEFGRALSEVRVTSCLKSRKVTDRRGWRSQGRK